MTKVRVRIDEAGRVILPPDIRNRYGILPGEELVLETGRDRLLFNAPIAKLSRIYVEPTSRCNMNCATCIRNSWDELPGDMQPSTYAAVLEALEATNPVPEIFFGGFGEPLSHSGILDMIREAKRLETWIELITNGVLLDAAMAEALVQLEVDRIWVSIDGASPESYEDVRLGNELPRIKENIHRLRQIKYRYPEKTTRLGISFVAMKRNIGDLPAVAELTRALGADTLHVSNILPHSAAMEDEILYAKRMNNWGSRGEKVLFPRIDIDSNSWHALQALTSHFELHDLVEHDFIRPRDTCPFIEKGSVSVKFDGSVSPCLPLLHANTNYLQGVERHTDALFFGNLSESPLLAIWNGKEYRKFRERVMEFDFSPCTACASCDLAESNQEDCFGSVPVSCGGCLWAQGFIQCP